MHFVFKVSALQFLKTYKRYRIINNNNDNDSFLYGTQGHGNVGYHNLGRYKAKRRASCS
jgi:hypothetical protein